MAKKKAVKKSPPKSVTSIRFGENQVRIIDSEVKKKKKKDRTQFITDVLTEYFGSKFTK